MLQTPLGRTTCALMWLIFATAGRASFGAAPPADGLVYTCTAPDIRVSDADRTEVEGSGAGFTYSFSYVQAKGDLAPFEQLQRDFATHEMARAAESAKASSVTAGGGKRTLGISFELSRRGDFAGLTADIGSTTTVTQRTYAGWLLHVPSGRLLTFDDVFVDPQTTRAMIVQKVRPMLTARLRGDYGAAPQVAATDIDPRILRVTDPGHASAWHLTLDHIDPCMPGLVLIFDGDQAPNGDHAEARLGSPSILAAMKPEIRRALGDTIPLTGTKPPFSSDIVARQFPELVDIASRNLVPIAELQPDLVGCPERSRDTLTVDMTVERRQWIYNGWYRWFYALRDTGVCVVLLYPEQRGLLRDEAWALLSAAGRRLPFDESRLDPAFASQYPTDIAQAFGGMSTFQHGTSHSLDYSIGFLGIDAPLQPLDVIQRRMARTEISSATRQAVRHRAAGTSHATLRMDFIAGGRTAELAVLVLQESIAFANGTTTPIAKTWMLHVPSGKLITFDDLFIDPAVVRKAISDGYRKNIMPSSMAFHAFIGDDHEKQAAAFRKTYQRNAYRLSTPSSDHFRNVQFSGDHGREGVNVFFSQEAVTKGDYAYGGASLKFLRKYLKPAYRHALDAAVASDATH